MFGYYCFEFADFMLAGKTLTDFRNIFPPNKFKQNDDIILNYSVTNVSKTAERSSIEHHSGECSSIECNSI